MRERLRALTVPRGSCCTVSVQCEDRSFRTKLGPVLRPSRAEGPIPGSPCLPVEGRDERLHLARTVCTDAPDTAPREQDDDPGLKGDAGMARAAMLALSKACDWIEPGSLRPADVLRE